MSRLALVAVCLVVSVGPARAHAFLRTASPPVGGAVATAPAEVAITFTEPVEKLFTTIEVQDPAGASVVSGPVEATNPPTRLSVRLRPLAPGRYKVVWHAVSVDTHRTEGSYSFTVLQADGH